MQDIWGQRIFGVRVKIRNQVYLQCVLLLDPKYYSDPKYPKWMRAGKTDNFQT